MRIRYFYIKYFEVEDQCPKCGETSGTDMGGMHSFEIPAVATFWCPECGEWERPLSFDEEIKRMRKEREEQ